MEDKAFYTCIEIADALDVTAENIRYMIRTGKLQAEKINGAYLIPAAAAKEFLQGRGVSCNTNTNGAGA